MSDEFQRRTVSEREIPLAIRTRIKNGEMSGEIDDILYIKDLVKDIVQRKRALEKRKQDLERRKQELERFKSEHNL
ncbi:MAG: hypothetical protein IKN16_09430 [Selenomonadaceae bacterium]|nr:hypothetical protein [Selenomonadaceae bacterium]